jgi:adenylate cyclase
MGTTGIGPDLTGKAAGGRRLIAVVYADMVGYSRLIGLDDAGTLRRLRTLRRALIDPAIREFGGRVVKTGGDSLLMAFDSIDGAVRCAVKVQQQVPVYDGDQPVARRIRFRVGINIGDVIPHGTNLYGDGVNIAARLEAECPVGGICVSRAVRDHVHGRLDLPFESVGELTLKNIARPVEAFVVQLDPVAEDLARHTAPDVAAAGGWVHSHWPLVAGIAGCLLIGVAGAGWWLSRDAGISRTESATIPTSDVSAAATSATASALKPPNVGLSTAPRLSIVVLPFENLGGDPKDDYLVEGITDDLTTDLSNITNAVVIARNSAYTYKGRAANVKQVGDELGVRYVLEGSVRRLGDVLRINAQLVSTESGAHLWADRFDEPIKDLTAGQEDIVKRLGNALGWELIWAEAARSTRDRSANPDAFDLYLRARSVFNLPYSLQHSAEAKALLERAVQLDPSFADAKAVLAGALINSYVDDSPTRAGDELQRAAALLSDAAAISPNSAHVLARTVFLLRMQWHWSEALAVAQRLMELYPNDAESYSQLATMKFTTGAMDEAIPLQEKSIRLDPRNNFLFERYQRIGYALLVLGREQESISWFERSSASNPGIPPIARARIFDGLAAAYALSGRSAEAHQAAAEAERADPFATVRSDVQWFGNEAAIMQTRRYQEWLRIAGLRDHADENADFGVTPDVQLHRVRRAYTPMTAPGTITIRTNDIESLLTRSRPIVIDTLWYALGRSLPGATGLIGSGIEGTFSDATQARLRSKIAGLTKGDSSFPIVAVGWNSERFDGYNLALRLVALGYTKVYWYRGGREAWEAADLPETQVDVQSW